MPAAFPSGSNTFIKDHRATNGLKIDFSRNVTDFPLNKYIQLQPVTKEAGYYLVLTVQEAGRIMNTDLSDAVWYDGQERPHRHEGTESFIWSEYRTQRYDYGFSLGDKAIDQSSWDLLETHSRIKAQQAVTGRTQKVITLATTAGTYDATHTSAVASISGNTGTWAQSTTARQDVKRSLNTAANIIKLDTLSAVKTKDLMLVVGPDTALEMSQTQEIVDHIKHSDHALAQIRGELPGDNVEFGLPSTLYGYSVVVEDSAKTTSHKGATVAKSYILGSGTAFMCSRPGDLVSPGDGPSFSTFMLFLYEELTVESLRNERDRLVEGHVVDDFAAVATAPVTGYLFTSAV